MWKLPGRVSPFVLSFVQNSFSYLSKDFRNLLIERYFITIRIIIKNIIVIIIIIIIFALISPSLLDIKMAMLEGKHHLAVYEKRRLEKAKETSAHGQAACSSTETCYTVQKPHCGRMGWFCPKYLFQLPNPKNDIAWGSQESQVPLAYRVKKSSKWIIWDISLHVCLELTNTDYYFSFLRSRLFNSREYVTNNLQ